MPLCLDARCLEQFKSELAKSLTDANVMHGRFVDPAWMWIGERIARILPQSPKSRAGAGLATISNLTLSFFLMDQLGEMLKSNAARVETERTKLSEQPGFEDTEQLATKLTDGVMTLPWDYELMILMPLDLSGATEIQLDERFALRAIAEADAPQYPVHPVDTLAQHMYHQGFPESIVSNRYYFGGRFTGYLHDVSPVPELEELLDAAKGVLGLALAAPVMKIGSIPRGTPPPAPPIIAYRVTAGVRELLPYRWLSADDTVLLTRLTMAVASNSLPAVLAAIQAAFKHTATRGAARWYLDSFGGTNGVLQTVQATVALEMLLGEKKQAEQVGITKLLANRLAFLIGRSPKQRDAIIADFVEKYDVRSDIVHNGKAVLGEAESAALYALRDYARRAIVKQLEQIWIEAGKPETPAVPSSG